MTVLLPSLAATAALATRFAHALLEGRLRTLLCTGPLGSGKTTFIRALVAALPGSEAAEVASPSFSLCNYYPVTPPLVHADLYRAAGEVPEEILDALEDPTRVLVLEWADLLPQALWPEEHLLLSFRTAAQGDEHRRLTVNAHGPHSCALLADVATHLPKNVQMLR